jgi:hypothetical protein
LIAGREKADERITYGGYTTQARDITTVRFKEKK